MAANLLGKPGKMDVQGHMVQDLFDEGKLPEINEESLRGLLMNVGMGMGELAAMSTLIDSVTYRQHGTDTDAFKAELNVNLSPGR